MIQQILRPSRVVTVILLSVGLLTWPMGTRAHADSTTFSGQATAVRATLLGTTTTLADTGPLPSSGGALEASLLSASVDGLLTADVLHAATIGQGDRSRSEASLADVSVTVAGNTVTADFLMARAMAACGPSVSGSSEIVNLVINGQTIAITGQPNQTVTLPGGAEVVINEQSSSTSENSGSIDVNALHVIVPRVADVVLSHAHADITCQGQPNCNTSNDFVTGGGWITTPSGAKGTFGVAGGIKNGALWGHLEYIDHGTGLKVHGTGVTTYTVTGTTSREIQGAAEVNGQSGFTYTVNVADNGDPGKGSDTFSLRLSNGYTAGGTLGGGNIQLHKPCQ